MTTPQSKNNTSAFYAQAWIAFAIALCTMIFAIFYVPVDAWIRAFLGITTLFLVSSAFTLAKVIRDAQESTAVVARIDQARVDRMLAEHDPFREVS